MLSVLFKAFDIFILVVVGMWLLWEIGIFSNHKSRHTKEVKVMKTVLNMVSIILFILGVAFLGGSFLAFLQGFVIQITVLAVTGTICFIVALICFLFNHLKKKEIYR